MNLDKMIDRYTKGKFRDGDLSVIANALRADPELHRRVVERIEGIQDELHRAAVRQFHQDIFCPGQRVPFPPPPLEGSGG